MTRQAKMFRSSWANSIGVLLGAIGTGLIISGVYEKQWWVVGAACAVAWMGLAILLGDDRS